MPRSLKYALHGAVLAGVVVGTVAWGGVDKTVTLVVDGHATKVSTTAADVSGVLRSAGITPGSHDIVAPAPTSRIHDGSEIVVTHGRELVLSVDGTRRVVWTTAPTVAAALADLGYPAQDFVSVSRSQRLPLSATAITLRAPKTVTVLHDGRQDRVRTTAATVRQLLTELRVGVHATDVVSVPLTSSIRPDETIRVTRVDRHHLVQQVVLPKAIWTIRDATLPSGTVRIVTAGRNGVARLTYTRTYLNGRLARTVLLRKVVLRQPVAEIRRVGTQAIVAAPPASAPSTVSTPSTTSTANTGGAATMTPAQAQAYAQSYMLSTYGWGADQFSCLVTLWDHESGWRVSAANPSGAYGIPQALPGSKMGNGWQSDARVQIAWGLSYIKARYANPCQAWSTWQAQGGWY